MVFFDVMQVVFHCDFQLRFFSWFALRHRFRSPAHLRGCAQTACDSTAPSRYTVRNRRASSALQDQVRTTDIAKPPGIVPLAALAAESGSASHTAQGSSARPRQAQGVASESWRELAATCHHMQRRQDRRGRPQESKTHCEPKRSHAQRYDGIPTGRILPKAYGARPKCDRGDSLQLRHLPGISSARRHVRFEGSDERR
jgi:hypothetical protein